MNRELNAPSNEFLYSLNDSSCCSVFWRLKMIFRFGVGQIIQLEFLYELVSKNMYVLLIILSISRI